MEKLNKKEINAIARVIIKKIKDEHEIVKNNYVQSLFESDEFKEIESCQTKLNKLYKESCQIHDCVKSKYGINLFGSDDRLQSFTPGLQSYIADKVKAKFDFTIPSIEDLSDKIIIEQLNQTELDIPKLVDKIIEEWNSSKK